MKIISPYKDYYDYLSGIYGEDPLIILDRRNHQQPNWIPNYHNNFKDCPIAEKYTLQIGNYIVDFIFYDNKFYYGEEILKIPTLSLKENNRYGIYDNIYSNELKNDFWVFLQEYNSKFLKIFKKPIKIHFNSNFPEIISLLKIEEYYDFHNREFKILANYPKLSDMNLNKFIKAETVYQWIYDYISEKNLEKEIHDDKRSDIEKLQSFGFDKKSSFRNIK